MVHFQWQEKDAPAPELDTIVFPGEATFEKARRNSPPTARPPRPRPLCLRGWTAAAPVPLLTLPSLPLPLPCPGPRPLRPLLPQVARPGSRVFVLKFGGDRSRDALFWAQDPRAEEDEALVAAVDGLLNASQGGWASG